MAERSPVSDPPPEDQWRPLTIAERQAAYMADCEANRNRWAQLIGLPDSLDSAERDRAIEVMVHVLHLQHKVLYTDDLTAG